MNTNEIKTNEIQFGVPMKYKDICAMFKDEAKSNTKSKNLQLKKWNKEYEVVKDKTWYTIVRELTDEEKELKQIEKKYSIYIENLLIKFLKEQRIDKGEMITTLTYHELYKLLGITNNYYNKVLFDKNESKNYKDNICCDFKMDSGDVKFLLDKFFEVTENDSKVTIKRALNSMQNKMLLVYSKSYRLYFERITNGVKWFEAHDCTDEETQQILNIYKGMMRRFNCEDMNSIYYTLNKKERKDFFDLIKLEIASTFNCDNYSPTYKLILSDIGINYDYDKLYTKKKLNNNYQEKLRNDKDMNKLVSEKLKEQFINDLIRI